MCGLAVPILRILLEAAFVTDRKGLVFGYRVVGQWELAMSELKQQSIALWILLMLLILVPWALE